MDGLLVRRYSGMDGLLVRRYIGIDGVLVRRYLGMNLGWAQVVSMGSYISYSGCIHILSH